MGQAFGWGGAVAVVAGVVGGWADDPGVAGLVEEAGGHAAEGRLDLALEGWLRAEGEAGGSEWAGVVRERLAEWDPLDAERRAVGEAAAGELVKVARSYQRKGWFETALELVDEADRYEPGGASTMRASLIRTLERKGWTPEVDEAAVEVEPVDRMPDLRSLYENDGWRYEDGVYWSRKPGGGACLFLGRRPTHEDARLRIEMNIGRNEPASAGFVLGLTGIEDYYIVEALIEPRLDGVRLEIRRFDSENGDTILAERNQTVPRIHEIGEWLPLVVEVRGREISATFADRVRATGTCPTLPHGGVGMYVAGSSPSREPVGYRSLTIEPLPERPAPGVDPVAAAVEAGVAEAVAAIEDDREEEGAGLLRRASAELLDMRASPSRDALEASIAELLLEHDPVRERVLEVRAELASALVEVGRQHAEAGRIFTAAELFAHARAHDRPVGDAALAEIDEALAPLRVERFGLPAEPVQAVDNAELRTWFESALESPIRGWAWTDTHVESAGVGGRSPFAVLASTSRVGPDFEASVLVDLLDEAAAGIAFGFDKWSDVYCVGFTHRADSSEIFVARNGRAGFQRIASSEVRFSDAAVEAWTTVGLRCEGGRLIVTCGEAEPLEAELEGADGSGRLGLFVRADGALGSARFRNFALAAGD